jgi:hypothetical protein
VVALAGEPGVKQGVEERGIPLAEVERELEEVASSVGLPLASLRC